jgi:hypothetical protein
VDAPYIDNFLYFITDMSNKINKAWHDKNKMPKNATLDQRIAWHTEHHKHCQCRDIPEKLKAEIIKKSKK